MRQEQNDSNNNYALLFQSGDENAYNEIVFRYRDRLMNFIYRFVNDVELAEDVLQDTLVKIFTHRHYYKEIAKVSTWIYTIAGNFSKTELRKRKRRKITQLSHMGKDDKVYNEEEIKERLKKELPLLAQYIECKFDYENVKVFGVSAQGGDLTNIDSKKHLLHKDCPSKRVMVRQGDNKSSDLTLILSWLLIE